MGSTPKETTTKVEPWDGAKPFILDYLKQADQMYKAGKPEYYQGSTVADQSSATKDALNQQEALARQGSQGITNAQNTVNNIAQGNNFSTQPNATLSNLQNGVQTGSSPATAGAAAIASGSNVGQSPGISTLTQGASYTNPAMAQAANAGSFMNAATGLQQNQANTLSASNNPAMDYLKSTASGANIGNNPYLDQMVQTQQNKIAEQLQTVTNPAIDSQAASLGRMGSAAYATQRNKADTTAATAMADVATSMYGNQYNTDKDRQLAASGQYGNFYNTDQQNQMQANSNLASTSNAQQGQQLAGTELYGNLSNTQQGLRNDAANALNSQYQFDKNYQLQGLGLQNDIYQQGVNNKFNNANLQMNAANSQAGNQNAQAGTQLGAAGMAGDMYGLGFLPSQYLAQIGQQRDDRAQNVLNADIQRHDFNQNQPLANIANMINLANGGNYSNTTTPVYSNTAGQIGGIASGLLGLLSLCDERTKIVFECVGKFPNGIPMYRFAYKDNPEEVFVGPLAHEVEAVLPDAVVEVNGIKMIINDTFMEAA
ncbi:hypothetical protein ACTOV4_02645 [Brucella sp. C7-11G]